MKEVPAASGAIRYAFPDPIGEQEAFYTLHSEAATLSKTIPGVRDVRWRLALPIKIAEGFRLLVQVGLASEEPETVAGGTVVPRELLVTLLNRLPESEEAPHDVECIDARVEGDQGRGAGDGLRARDVPPDATRAVRGVVRHGDPDRDDGPLAGGRPGRPRRAPARGGRPGRGVPGRPRGRGRPLSATASPPGRRSSFGRAADTAGGRSTHGAHAPRLGPPALRRRRAGYARACAARPDAGRSRRLPRTADRRDPGDVPRRDGTVLLSPVWHEWRDGGFNVSTTSGDVKVRHVTRHPQRQHRRRREHAALSRDRGSRARRGSARSRERGRRAPGRPVPGRGAGTGLRRHAGRRHRHPARARRTPSAWDFADEL